MMAINATVDEADPLLVKHNRTISKSTSQLALVGSRVCPIESLDFEYSSLSACHLLRPLRLSRVVSFCLYNAPN
ncbi:hypothetical protein MA16_Dca004498 [Dendrobium catenatum]|uniref:Uncharacterized protein n=1 Tax=Dendrobium catenatum TaxID=906689 RepID=A0A2I0W7L8_9ASPA|nr:hypothetical protein MA16_Dca004498 [Dendrobium catenatum]